jgi:DNA-binding MarR family transcriptional regulator
MPPAGEIRTIMTNAKTANASTSAYTVPVAAAPAAVPQGTAGTAFESSTFFLLVTLGNRLNVLAERRLRRSLDLTVMEWRVLTVLAVEPAAPPGRIVTIAGVNKAAVSRAVNSLERRGLLHRTAAPGHRLRTQLFLTPAGEELHNRGWSDRDLAEKLLLAGFSDEERAAFKQGLRKVMRTLDAGRLG